MIGPLHHRRKIMIETACLRVHMNAVRQQILLQPAVIDDNAHVAGCYQLHVPGTAECSSYISAARRAFGSPGPVAEPCCCSSPQAGATRGNWTNGCRHATALHYPPYSCGDCLAPGLPGNILPCTSRLLHHCLPLAANTPASPGTTLHCFPHADALTTPETCQPAGMCDADSHAGFWS